MPGGRYPWAVRAGGPLLGGGGLSTLFDWNPEIAQALPATATFTRTSSNRQVLTTTTGPTFRYWYQQCKPGEVPLEGLRRVENLLDSSNGTGPFSNITKNGRLAVSVIASSGTLTINIGGIPQVFTPTGTPQRFVAFDEATGGSTSVTISGTATLSQPMAHLYRFGNSNPEPYVQHDAEFLNIGANGVTYFNTANTSTVDGDGVVTFSTGTTIPDGGFSPNTGTINRLLHSNDMTNAAWSAIGAVSTVDLGVDDIGGQATRVSGLGASGADDISQAAAGFTANNEVAASLSLRRVSTTGVLSIINSTGAANGEWQVDLSLIGANWIQLKADDSTSPIVTTTVIQERNPDILEDVILPVESSAVFDVTVSGVTIPGFSEVTPWIADGGGNAGVLFHAASGGPLTVDIAFNQLEDSDGAFRQLMSMMGVGGASSRTFRVALPSTLTLANNDISASVVASTSYKSERHSFGMSLKTNEGIVVDDEDNDNDDTNGTPGQGTVRLGLNPGSDGLAHIQHRARVYAQAQTVEELKALF